MASVAASEAVSVLALVLEKEQAWVRALDHRRELE